MRRAAEKTSAAAARQAASGHLPVPRWRRHPHQRRLDPPANARGTAAGRRTGTLPECALSGYAGTDLPSAADLDWDLLHKETDSILALAKELGVWVVLGSNHRLSGDHKPHNSLYVINSQGQIVDRYDKRFCTDTDLRYYSPGDHFVTFGLNGVKCGLLICYDMHPPGTVSPVCEDGRAVDVALVL